MRFSNISKEGFTIHAKAGHTLHLNCRGVIPREPERIMQMRNFFLLAALLLAALPLSAQTLTVTLSTCTFAGNAQPLPATVSGVTHTIWAYMRPGDTWTCRVTAPVAGNYAVTTITSTASDNASLHFELPKGTKVGSLPVTNTFGWDQWKPQTGTVTLPAGQSTLLLVADGIVNLDNILTLTSLPPQLQAVTISANLTWDDKTPVQGAINAMQWDDATRAWISIAKGTLDAAGNISLSGNVNVVPLSITLYFGLNDAAGATVSSFQQTFPALFVKMLTGGKETCSFVLVKGSNPVSLAKFPSCQP